MRKAFLVLILLAAFEALALEKPGAPILNREKIEKAIGLEPYFNSRVTPKKKIKIAIFDNGFRYAKDEIGKSLPASVKLHTPKIPISGEEEAHGFYMARILWDLISRGGKDEKFLPAEFHLYPTFGYTNFKEAVEDAIAQKINIVLYSQTWEYGGNYNGKGFINTLVNKALDAGILWINNSGNFGQGTYNSAVTEGDDSWVKLPHANQSVEIRCKKNSDNKCKLRAVLSWNSFSDDVEKGTDKDLDLILNDDTLNVVQSSTLEQKTNPAESEQGVSKYPREIVSAELKPGVYYLRVKIRSKNFSSSDQLRITASGESITMKDFDKNESLLPPADNARVVSVGALDTEQTSISRKLKKPELWTDSLMSFSENEKFLGTSNSAAIVAAGATVLMSQRPLLDREMLLDAIVSTPSTSGGADGAGASTGENAGSGLPLESLEFSPLQNGCFEAVELNGTSLPPPLQNLVSKGGVLVKSNAGTKMFFNEDPLPLTPIPQRVQPNDIVGWGLRGFGLFPRQMQRQLTTDFVELLQIPLGQSICGQNSPSQPNTRAKVEMGNVFKLPGI